MGVEHEWRVCVCVRGAGDLSVPGGAFVGEPGGAARMEAVTGGPAGAVAGGLCGGRRAWLRAGLPVRGG